VYAVIGFAIGAVMVLILYAAKSPGSGDGMSRLAGKGKPKLNSEDATEKNALAVCVNTATEAGLIQAVARGGLNDADQKYLAEQIIGFRSAMSCLHDESDLLQSDWALQPLLTEKVLQELEFVCGCGATTYGDEHHQASVCLNTANAVTLGSVPRMGADFVNIILDYRSEGNCFHYVDDLDTDDYFSTNQFLKVAIHKFFQSGHEHVLTADCGFNCPAGLSWDTQTLKCVEGCSGKQYWDKDTSSCVKLDCTECPVQALFSPRGGIATSIKAQLGEAKKTLDLALRKITTESLRWAIVSAAKRGVVVRLLMAFAKKGCSGEWCDAMKSAGVQVRYTPVTNYHSYVVIDSSLELHEDDRKLGKAFTGTGTWSPESENKYDDDWVRYQMESSPATVSAFQLDFDFLFERSMPRWTDQPQILKGSTQLVYPKKSTVVFTTPNFKWKRRNQIWTAEKKNARVKRGEGVIQNTIIKAIQSATVSIQMAHTVITSKRVIQQLIKASDRNVKITIVLDGRVLQRYTKNIDLVKTCGADVYYKVYSRAHDWNLAQFLNSKTTIIDKRVVLTGSYQISDNSENRGLNNMVTIKSSRIVKQYVKNFEEVTMKYGGTTGLQKAKSNPKCHFNPITLQEAEITKLYSSLDDSLGKDACKSKK
jgi:phosphatidylserine/phosphatidylglycerophosphate/cardiolipin synthase-like enzyme/DNA uptake protein ComE-like DNA-binding protein